MDNYVNYNYPVVIKVGEETYNLTEESLRALILSEKKVKEDNKHLSEIAHKDAMRFINMRSEVYDFFNERHETGDTKITASVEDINQLLESIGADQLRNLYSASVTVNVIIRNIEAVDDEDVISMVTDELQVDCGSFDVEIDNIVVDEVYEE